MREQARRTPVIVLVIAVAMTVGGCDDSGEGGAPGIEDDFDAWLVYTDVLSTINSLVVYSRSTDKSWSNETTDGEQGTVTIDGSYDHTSYTAGYNPEYDYEFVDVSLSFDGYTRDSDDGALLLSGNATLDGTVHEASSSSGSSYTGGWTLNGTFDLDGRFSDEVNLRVSFREDSMMRDYSGSLTTGSGQSYSIAE